MDNISGDLRLIHYMQERFNKMFNEIKTVVKVGLPDPPAPDKPYEMLGKVEIVTPRGTPYHYLETKERGGNCFRFAKGVNSIGESKSRDTALCAYVHEHSCGIEALGLLEHIIKHLEWQPGASIINNRSESTYKAKKLLARLNAGPEKGVPDGD